MANTEVERHTGVDVEDVPSAEWGWSKENHRLIHIGGLLSAGFLLLMMHGNHVGHVEDLFLIGIRRAHRHRGRARLVAAPPRLDQVAPGRSDRKQVGVQWGVPAAK